MAIILYSHKYNSCYQEYCYQEYSCCYLILEPIASIKTTDLYWLPHLHVKLQSTDWHELPYHGSLSQYVVKLRSNKITIQLDLYSTSHYYSTSSLTGVNIVVSVLWWVSLGNIHNAIGSSLNGLQELAWISVTKLRYVLVEFRWVHMVHMTLDKPHKCVVAYRHTWYSLSNPLSLSLCMAFTCLEKWDLSTAFDAWDADSAAA